MSLKVINKLLLDLNSNEIDYCHWKSNEHLDASMNAETDLDILFNKSQKQKVVEILESNGFHLFEAVWYKKYSGIVDYIGFDEETGKIIHLHTHFNLDMGEVGIKSYSLPWEDTILDTKIFNSEYNIYTSLPEVEFLLLVVRTALKLDPIDYRLNGTTIKHFDIEAEWLYQRTELEEIKIISNQLLGEKTTGLIAEIRLNEKYDKKLFFTLRKQLKSHFSDNRVLSRYRVNQLKIIKIYGRLKRRFARKLNLKVRNLRRTLPNEGVVVSLMGCDGAGKSTQTELITNELSKKVDVLFMYMGSGKGEKSFQRKSLDYIIGLKNKKKKKESNKDKNNIINDNKQEGKLKKGFKSQLLYSIRAASLAYERKSKLKKIDKERKRGGIVICDRYPQTTTLGYNDGLKLYPNLNSSNSILKALAKYEYSCYNLANEIYPDLVIKLVGDLEVLKSRRPEMSMEVLDNKQQGIIDIKFGKNTKVITSDIDKPIVQIKGEILKAISNQIS